MKRMLRRIFAIAAALMLLAASSLAETKKYSPTLAAERLAIAAMQDKYGFTLETLGLFNVQTTVAGEMACVHFRCGFLPYSRVGEYTVLINGGRLSITWTHDDKDPALYQSGDPEAPYWGVKQMEAYLAVDSGARAEWVKAFYARGEQDVHIPASMWDDLGLVRLPEEQQTRAPIQVTSAARDALMDVYGVDHEMLNSLEMGDTDSVVSAAGIKYYSLTYANPRLCFHVLVDAETCEVLSITPSSGGNG